MAIVPVQSVITANASVTATFVTTFSISLSAVGSGNAICGALEFVGSTGTTSITTIVDDAGSPNTYTKSTVTQLVADGNSMVMFYLANVTGGPTTITVNGNGGATLNFCRFVVSEFSGVLTASALDVGFGNPVGQSNVATTTDLIKSPSVTTLADGDLIYAATCNTEASTGITAGSTFTQLVYGADADTVPMMAEYKIQSAHGAVTGDFTAKVSTHNYLTGMIPLKAAIATLMGAMVM